MSNPKHGVLSPSIQPKDYILGATSGCPWEIVNKSGSWLGHAPKPHEMQLQQGVDLAMCTNFAATDTVEAILHERYGEMYNFNERALAVMSNQQINGNNLGTVAEAIRTKGLVMQDCHPWNPSVHDTYEKMMDASQEEVTDWIEQGQMFLQTYDVRWEWVWSTRMREALKCAPLFAASLYASENNKEGDIYKTDLPNSDKTTHAIVLLKQQLDGYKYIDDSYEQQIKKLDVDFNVPVGIRFWIRNKKHPEIMYYPPKNSLVIVPDTGERLMYVDGNTIFKDDHGKILLEVTARNAKDGVSGSYPIIHKMSSEIKHLKRINLKREYV